MIARAREVLDRLEANDRARGPRGVIDDLPLFAAAKAEEPKEAVALVIAPKRQCIERVRSSPERAQSPIDWSP